MTISLAVILLEATSQIIFAPPIVLTLLVAKWVGDEFDLGIYDIHIELKNIPLLEWEAEEEMKRFQNADVMKTDLVTTCVCCAWRSAVLVGEGGRWWLAPGLTRCAVS
jgi:hypothetical protein